MALSINNLLCVGCGDCTTVCSCNAIYESDNTYLIDAQLCDGCGFCKNTCCQNAIGEINSVASCDS